VGEGGEMTQALYAHMNNKIIIKKTISRKWETFSLVNFLQICL
jgi:hypothetical protein